MKSRTKPLALLAAATLATGVVACGDDESTGAPGNATDRAFVEAMVPHHRSAVDMAEVARRRTKRAAIKKLAEKIIATQTEEIQRMQTVNEALDAAGVDPGKLGTAPHEMGMDMDAAMLKEAKPFDREFIDAMIAHHQGAIRMARVELDKGESPGLRSLAEAIVDAQSMEIDQMNTWRVDWFGSLSPAGGVPAEDDDHSEHGM
jgi:uncharacterized protein (DUF305 family)